MFFLSNINEKNYIFYKDLIPKDIMEEVMEDRYSLIFGIEAYDTACGAVAVRLTRPEAQILWYYIDPGFRGQGIGSDIFIQLTSILYYNYDIDYVSMELYAGADPKLRRLFYGYEATYEDLRSCSFSTTVGRLYNCPKLSGHAKHCISFRELDDAGLYDLSKKLRQNGMEFIEFPIKKEDYLSDVSAVYMADDKPAGILLVKKRGQDVEIPFLASLSKDPRAIMEMMCFTRKAAVRLGEDTVISMNLVDPRFVAVLKNILDMDDEEDGFVHGTRITLPLDYKDEIRAELDQSISLWQELDSRKER